MLNIQDFQSINGFHLTLAVKTKKLSAFRKVIYKEQSLSVECDFRKNWREGKVRFGF